MCNAKELATVVVFVLIGTFCPAFGMTGSIAGRPTAIAADSSGVYVTGWTLVSVTGKDFLIAKYAHSDGALLWNRTFPDTSTTDRTDSAVALELDNKGNVYVVGNCRDAADTLNWIAVVKYNSAGTRMAVSDSTVYGEVAFAAATDGAGQLFVAGAKAESSKYGFLVARYDSLCRRGGASICTVPGVPYAMANDVAVDGSGNFVYVTGACWNSAFDSCRCLTLRLQQFTGQITDTLIYDSGTAHSYGSAVCAVDSNAVVVAGYCGNSLADYLMLFYTLPNPNPVVRTYDGNGRDDAADDVAIDDSHYVYVTGRSAGSDGPFDIATLKYSFDGQEKWRERFDANDTGIGHAVHLAVGRGSYLSTGHIHIGGTAMNAGQGRGLDFSVVTYKADSSIVWADAFGQLGAGDDCLTGLAVATDGNVCATGYSVDSEGKTEFLTAELDDSNGFVRWTTYVEEKEPPLVLGELRLTSSIVVRRAVEVHYALPGATRARVELRDAVGRLALSQPIPPSSTGTTRLAVSRLAAGVYFLRLVSDGLVATRKVVLRP